MSRKGVYQAICDVCGFKFRADQLTKRWDGLMVCHEDFEVRHPQDFIKIRPDQTRLPWTRPEPTDVTAYTDLCTVASRHAYAGYGTAGCMIAGYNLYTEENLLNNFFCSVEGRTPYADYATADCAEV